MRVIGTGGRGRDWCSDGTVVEYGRFGDCYVCCPSGTREVGGEADIRAVAADVEMNIEMH